jgi:hypothetical protein
VGDSHTDAPVRAALVSAPEVDSVVDMHDFDELDALFAGDSHTDAPVGAAPVSAPDVDSVLVMHDFDELDALFAGDSQADAPMEAAPNSAQALDLLDDADPNGAFVVQPVARVT